MNASLLIHSLGLGALATGLATLFGLAVALALWGVGPGGRRVGLGAAALALALPPFLVANVWLELTESWRLQVGAAAAREGGLPVVALLEALAWWPLITLPVLGQWQQFDAAFLEVDPAARGRALLARVLLPAAAGVLAPAAAVVLSLSLAHFTLPVLFQVPVFTEAMWVRFNTRLDAVGTLAAGWPLVVLPLVLLRVLLRRPAVPWARVRGGADPATVRRHLGGLFPLAVAGAAGVVGLAVVLPLGKLLLARRTWTELPAALLTGGPALAGTLGTALATATGVTLGGLWLAGGGFGRRRVPRLAWLGFLVPGILWGVGWVTAWNRSGLDFMTATFAGAGVALLARFLAPGWAGVARALAAADAEWIEAARLEASGGWRRWRVAVWPQVAGLLGATWYAVYLLCLWEVETLVLLLPPGGETVAVRVFNLLHYGHAGLVNALCLALLGLAGLPWAGWEVGRAVGRWVSAGRGRGGRGGMAAGLSLWLFLGGCSPREPASRATLDSVTFAAVEVIGSRGVAPGQFHKPRSVVCDRDDNLYVADITGRIQKFDSAGRFLRQWQMPETELGKPKGLGLDPAGHVLVVEPHYMRVNHFDGEGRLVGQWGRRGTNGGEFILARGVAVDGQGRYYLCEYTQVDRVQRFGPAGFPTNGTGFRAPAFERQWGRPGTGPGEFNRAEGLTVDAAGRVLVADSCNHRIQVFDADGRFLRAHGSAGSHPGQFSYPYDIRVDPGGRQFVCEFGNSRISVLGPDDRLVEVIGRAGGAPGQFANPWALALDSRGNLYVADSQNHRVQKLLRRRSG